MNYYKQVAEMLGLQLGEEFLLKNVYSCELFDTHYRITDHGVEWKNSDNFEKDTDDTLMDIIKGDYAIVKLPFKPQRLETYYFVDFNYTNNFESISDSSWTEDEVDYTRYYIGNCFKTKEEALNNKDKIISKLKAKYKGDSYVM